MTCFLMVCYMCLQALPGASSEMLAALKSEDAAVSVETLGACGDAVGSGKASAEAFRAAQQGTQETGKSKVRCQQTCNACSGSPRQTVCKSFLNSAHSYCLNAHLLKRPASLQFLLYHVLKSILLWCAGCGYLFHRRDASGRAAAADRSTRAAEAFR